MQEAIVKRFLDVLYDPTFINLRIQADYSAIRWNDFRSMPMPKNLTPRQTWKILTAIRRQTAIVWPMKTYFDISPNADLWHTDTQRIIAMQSEIDTKCRQESPLFAALSKTSKYVLGTQTAQDIAAAAKRDGVEVSVNRVFELLSGRSVKETNVDFLLSNAADILNNLGAYTERKVTPGLIEELYFKLLKDVEPFELKSFSRYSVSTQSAYTDPDYCIGALCRLVENSSQSSPISPLVKVSCVWSILWDLRPLPSFNALVEAILRRIIFRRFDYPVLCWIPFSNIILNWDHERYSQGEAPSSAFEYSTDTGVDCTSDVESIYAFIIKGIETLKHIVMDSQRAEDDLLQNTLPSHQLNLRQRHILRLIMENPQRKLTIAMHRRICGISYATARNDLLTLASTGFLQQYKINRAFAFRLHPNMLESLPLPSIESSSS
jgi:hypothetical protein